MSAHTPGPWWVMDSGVRDRGGYICHTNPAQRYEGQDDRFAQESAERAANKLLIAAAPDLLEALIAAVKYSDAMHRAQAHVDGETVDYETFPAWRAVIAKATGAAS